MRQTRAAALLWAYDIGSKFGIAWRPRTILLMLGMVAVLGLCPRWRWRCGWDGC